MKRDVYSKSIVVGEENLDDLNHVNNVVYLHWVLDIAKEHWLLKTGAAINERFFWVVRSHHIDYKKQAFLGDRLDIKTFVDNYKGPFSERVVRFYKEDSLLVEACSNWCLIDSASKKPARIPQEIQELFVEG